MQNYTNTAITNTFYCVHVWAVSACMIVPIPMAYYRNLGKCII